MSKLLLLTALLCALSACGGTGHEKLATCNAPNADAIMAWAKGVGGHVEHTREAQVMNYQGHVVCGTGERASSGIGRSPGIPLLIYPSAYSGHYYPHHNWHYRGW